MKSALDVLVEAGVRLEPGLTDFEIDALERRFDLRLPADYRALVASVLPTGDRWPRWRDLDDPHLQWQVGWPQQGVLMDVEYRQFWHTSWWGDPPATTEAAVAVARSFVTKWPRLVPVHGHSYILSDAQPGAPILSVSQTDVVPYGRNLLSFLEREMNYISRYREGLMIPAGDEEDLSDVVCHPWLDLEPWRNAF